MRLQETPAADIFNILILNTNRKLPCTSVVNASPVSMGLPSRRCAPDRHPAPPHVKELRSRAARHCQRRGADLVK